MGCTYSSPALGDGAGLGNVKSFSWARDNTNTVQFAGYFNELDSAGSVAVETRCTSVLGSVTPTLKYTGYSDSSTSAVVCSSIAPGGGVDIVHCPVPVTDLGGTATFVFQGQATLGPSGYQEYLFTIHSGPGPTPTPTIFDYSTFTVTTTITEVETVYETESDSPDPYCPRPGKHKRTAAPESTPPTIRGRGYGSIKPRTQDHWAQCGGIGWSGGTQCKSGSSCQVINNWYYQCIPGANPTTASSTTTTNCAQPGSTGVVKEYQQCGGKHYSGPTQCRLGFICEASDSYYSQCRPEPVQLGKIPGFGQCGGAKYFGITECTRGWNCVYAHEYYSQCLLSDGDSGSCDSPTTSIHHSTTSSTTSSRTTPLSTTSSTKSSTTTDPTTFTTTTTPSTTSSTTLITTTISSTTATSSTPSTTSSTTTTPSTTSSTTSSTATTTTPSTTTTTTTSTPDVPSTTSSTTTTTSSTPSPTTSSSRTTTPPPASEPTPAPAYPGGPDYTFVNGQLYLTGTVVETTTETDIIVTTSTIYLQPCPS